MPDLNEWIKQYAGQNQRRRLSRTYVAIGTDEPEVIGFVTLAIAAVQQGWQPGLFRRSESKLPTKPAIMIARLAVNTEQQKQGAGGQRVMFALKIADELSQRVGCQFVMVDPWGSAAEKFFEAFGFGRLGPSESRMFLPMKQINENL